MLGEKLAFRRCMFHILKHDFRHIVIVVTTTMLEFNDEHLLLFEVIKTSDIGSNRAWQSSSCCFS